MNAVISKNPHDRPAAFVEGNSSSCGRSELVPQVSHGDCGGASILVAADLSDRTSGNAWLENDLIQASVERQIWQNNARPATRLILPRACALPVDGNVHLHAS